MTRPRRPAEEDRPRPPREDSMSDRQIAATVRFGRKVTLVPIDHDEMTGYVAGVDRYMIFLLVPQDEDEDEGEWLSDSPVAKWLVHKSGTLILLHDESTLDREPEEIRDLLRKIIVPFRDKVMDEYYPDVPRHNRGFSTD